MSVPRIKVQAITATVANGTATANGGSNTLNGIVRSISVNNPLLTSATFDLVITGPATGFTLFSKTGMAGAAGQKNIVSDGTAGNLPITGLAVNESTGITINTSGNETGAKAITVTLLIDR